MVRNLIVRVMMLVFLIMAGSVSGALAQNVAPYLADLRQYPISDRSVGQFLEGIKAEKKASADALASLGQGNADAGALGSLMKCLGAGSLLEMGGCGGNMAGEKSPQEQASGLEDRVYEGLKQRFWIFFDGTAAERKAQFSASELAVLEKHRQALAAYREMFQSPHPTGA
jgi:hypothetical protein